VLAVVRCLLIEPYPESALNEEAGRALLEDYAAYAQHAALMTSLHAAKRGGPLTGSAAANVSGGCGGGGSSPGSKRTRPADARPAAAGAAPGVSAGTTTAAAAKAKKSLKRL
jgi:ubiquitin-conjugating enzyme E2 S